MRIRNKYAKIGDFVHITTPKEFIRCGYPLSIKGIMTDRCEEIEKHVARIYVALQGKPTPVEVLTPSSAEDSWLDVTILSEQSDISATVHGMLGAAVAAWIIEKENFGGKERQIFEQDNYILSERSNEPWQVIGKKIVKTGRRFPSSGYYSSYDGEYSYEPGGLDNEKTHCVYSLQRGFTKLSVLAVNCAKVEGK